MVRTITFIALTVLTLNSYSQNKHIQYGIKGGLNYSNFIDNNDTDIPVDHKTKVGFYLGGFVSFAINEKISIRPELLYAQQGSGFNIDAADAET